MHIPGRGTTTRGWPVTHVLHVVTDMHAHMHAPAAAAASAAAVVWCMYSPASLSSRAIPLTQLGWGTCASARRAPYACRAPDACMLAGHLMLACLQAPDACMLAGHLMLACLQAPDACRAPDAGRAPDASRMMFAGTLCLQAPDAGRPACSTPVLSQVYARVTWAL